ncbi:hypothetical protein ACFXTH_042319 [Malus domestica]
MPLASIPAPSTSDLSVLSKSHPILSGSSFKPTRGKMKHLDRHEDDEMTVQSHPLPRDAFRIRQIQKAHGTASQTGSALNGSAISGDPSGSTG